MFVTLSSRAEHDGKFFLNCAALFLFYVQDPFSKWFVEGYDEEEEDNAAQALDDSMISDVLNSPSSALQPFESE